MEWEIFLLSNSLGFFVMLLIVLIHFIGSDKAEESKIEYIA